MAHRFPRVQNTRVGQGLTRGLLFSMWHKIPCGSLGEKGFSCFACGSHGEKKVFRASLVGLLGKNVFRAKLVGLLGKKVCRAKRCLTNS